MVDIEAVSMRWVSSCWSSGSIMWASAVVVHEAADTMLCSDGSKELVVDAVDQHHAVVRAPGGLVRDLERRAHQHQLRSGLEVALQAAARVGRR